MSFAIRTFVVVTSLFSFHFTYAQSCNESQQQAIGTFKSTCSGSYPCNVVHPEGYLIPTDQMYNLTPVPKIQGGNILFLCQASQCPQYMVPGSIPDGGSAPLCEDSPYAQPPVSKSPPVGPDGKVKCASIVDVDAQTLGESVSLLGVGYSLNYFSHMSAGRNRSATFALTGSSAVPNTSGFKIRVSSGNTVYVPEFTMANQPQLSYTFDWNGNDASGNPSIGPMKFTVSSTQVFSTGTNEILPVVNEIVLGGFNAKILGLGGWLPSIYHYYSSSTGEVYDGGGKVRKVDIQPLATSVQGATYMIGNVGNSEVYYFDAQGKQVFTKTSLTGETIYTFNYDTQGQLESIAEPFNRLTKFERDASGNLARIVAPKGVYTAGSSPSGSSLLSPASLVTLVAVDSNGNIASVRGFDTPTNAYSMTYSSAGLLLTFQKPGGQVSTFTYNSRGDLTKDSHSGGYFFDLLKSFNADGTEKITSTTSGGLQTEYIFGKNVYGQPKRTVTTPDGVQEEYEVGTNTYHTSVGGSYFDTTEANDWRIPGSTYVYSSSVAGGGYFKYFSQTVNPQLVDTTDPYSIVTMGINESDGFRQSNTVYSGANRIFASTTTLGSTSEVTIDSFERVTSQKRGNLLPVDFTYTGANVTKIKQGPRETTLSYDSATGFLQSITNPLNQTTGLQYNTSGKISSQVFHDLRAIGYTYDSNGNLASLTTPKNIVHAFTFNTSELASSYVAPMASGNTNFTTTYEYNLDKQLKKITRPGNDPITMEYQTGTGVLNKIVTPSGNYEITTDSMSGRPSIIKSPSNLKTQIAYAGPVVMAEDLLSSQGQLLGGYQRYFSWDLLSSDLVKGGDGTTSSIYYGYDADNKLTQAGDLSLSYNMNEQLIGTSMGPAGFEITDEYTYNAFGEVTHYEVKRGTVTLYNLLLVRDSLGRVTQKTQTMRGLTDVWGYSYDSAGRLASVSRNGASYSQYNYDANGNRTGGFVGAQSTSATYDAQDRLSTYNAFAYTFKPNGSLYQKKNTVTNYTYTFNYDSVGNLKKYYQADVASAVYDHDGRDRVAGRYFNGAIDRRWIYMDKYRIAAELVGPSGNLGKRFIYGSKSNIPDYYVSSGQTYRVISDNLGSPRLVIRVSDGLLVSWVDHDEFGRVLTSSNMSIPFGFAGGFYDGKTPLVRFGARDYDPETGRWTSKDPILFGGREINLYGYSFMDPVNFIDPTGLDACGMNQGSGAVVCIDNNGDLSAVDRGSYSGKGPGKNNPSSENVTDTGPIPTGSYNIGPSVPGGHMGPGTRHLTPTPNTRANFPSNRNPDTFNWHGDNKDNPGEASMGCPISGPNTRNAPYTGSPFDVNNISF